MGLITKEVEVNLHNSNIKHYEEKGYEIPRYLNNKNKLVVKRGTKIIVKVEDLMINSEIMVQCLCDYCLRNDKETIYDIKYGNYLIAKNKALELNMENTDCCDDCRKIKTKETIKHKYGVEKIMDVMYFKELNATQRRRDIKLIDEEFTKRGYLPCFISYKNTDIPLPFICLKHKDKGIQYVRFLDLQNIICGCKYCSDELRAKNQTFTHEYAETFYTKKDYLLLDTYIKSDIPMRFICEKHPCEIQTASLATVIVNKDNCKFCNKENISGENSALWKDGITLFRYFLYKSLKEWRKDSLKLNGYKCVFTGGKDFHVHHLYSFNKILKETMNILDMQMHKNINDYNSKEKKILQILF